MTGSVKSIIKNSNNIVFFGGAGVSTGSGIPDFRSSKGLYSRDTGKEYSPEYLLSRDFFISHPEEFREYIIDSLIYPQAKPNKAHIILGEMEKKGKLKGIITQNIDGLHQMAGSENVVELHGNINRLYCDSCGAEYSMEQYQEKYFECRKCKGNIRPDIVLYGEGLSRDAINRGIELISNADVLIVGGTSLMVQPAAGLIDFYRGDKLIIINKDFTAMDGRANFLLNGDIEEILLDITEGI